MAIAEMTALACRAAVTTNAGLVLPEHYLAAIVDPASNEPEKVVLEDCGVTLDALEAVLRRSPIPGDTTSDGLKIGKLNPESLVLRGRAEGFAAASARKYHRATTCWHSYGPTHQPRPTPCWIDWELRVKRSSMAWPQWKVTFQQARCHPVAGGASLGLCHDASSRRWPRN